MARVPTVRFNEKKQRWMAWVRMPDGSRRKIERTDKERAERDLKQALAERSGELVPLAERKRAETFAGIIEMWLDEGCPNTGTGRQRHAKTKNVKTIAQARGLLTTWVVPRIGELRVDHTARGKIEEVFAAMDEAGRAADTIYRTWRHLHTAIEFGRVRKCVLRVNPAAEVLLPEPRPPQERRAYSLDEVRHLIEHAIPKEPYPAKWMVGFMCGLRPGELTGLRWRWVNLDDDVAWLAVEERADYDDVGRYSDQADPKGGRFSKRTIELHPLVLAALLKHREEMTLLGRYAPDALVFGTRNGTAEQLSNLRRSYRRLCEAGGIEGHVTPYDMRHTFVTHAESALGDLRTVADIVGHVDTKTTLNYRHKQRAALPGAREAYERLLRQAV